MPHLPWTLCFGAGTSFQLPPHLSLCVHHTHLCSQHILSPAKCSSFPLPWDLLHLCSAFIHPQTSLSVGNLLGPQRCEEKALTPRSTRCPSSLCFSTAHRGCSPLLTSPHCFPSAATSLHGFSSAITLQPLALPQPCLL